MPISRALLVGLLLCTTISSAQVLSPMEVTDPAMRRLQQRHMEELKAIAGELKDHKFPFAFYLSRKLDIEELEQKQADQRSIRFERYDNRTTLEITGNYYAAYSNDRVDADHRLRQTFVDVILPILHSAVLHLESEGEIEAFAVEVSHHVRRKVMGVGGEFAENIAVVVPREVAVRLVRVDDPEKQQQLMLDAEVYLSGEPEVLWLTGDKPVVSEERQPRTPKHKQETADAPARGNGLQVQIPATRLPTLAPAASPPELTKEPLHDSTPQGLKELLERHQDAIGRLVREQDASAHFVAYAPPAFISFKQGAYLQVSLTTSLDAAAGGSQYKQAALAFDRHIAHLVRPALAYFKDLPDFDGFDFSTTVKTGGGNEGGSAEAVEFIFPMAAMRCYEQFDCTGQQLINAGIVLINGERVELQLQSAEAR